MNGLQLIILNNKAIAMGTRHIIMIVKDGETKVAQYGQWDGYPSGQGKQVLEFLTNLALYENLETFKNQLDKCRFGTDEETEKLFNTDTNARPFLTRDAGADILTLIANTHDKQIVLQDASNFANESLMCEWVYVIDFDNNTFEVYEGFKNNPVPDDNRFQLPEGEEPYDGHDGTLYYPCVEVKRWNLDNLPTPYEFVNVLEPADPDEEEPEDEFNADAVQRVIDKIRNGNHGNAMVTDRICNFLDDEFDKFMDSYNL